jgi:hypothetical protein
MNATCQCDSTYRCPLCNAAPELLAALVAMVEDAPSAEEYDMRESVNAARAAIRKATGG